MKQGKLTLVLLIFCVLSAGVYFLLRQHVKTTTKREEEKSRVFSQLMVDRIKRVEIMGGERHVELVRDGQKWLMKKPISTRAETGEVEGLLHMVEFLEHKRRIGPEEMSSSKNTMADYGLEKPRLLLKLETENDAYLINVGHEARQSDGVYVRVNDKPGVYLVARSFAEQLGQPVEQWRNRSVLDLEGAIARVEIKSPKRVVEFARQNDAWRVVQPLNSRAANHAVESLVSSLEGLQAEKFLSDGGADLKKFHLDEPRYQITVKTDKSGDQGQVLLIGAPVDAKHWSAMRKGQHAVMAVSSQMVEPLDADLKDFRDPQLVHLDKRDVEAFEVRQGEKVIRVERGGEGWKITDPKAAAADRDLVDQFLSRFAGMKIQEFTTDILTEVEKYGLGEKSPMVRLFGKPVEQGQEPRVLANVRIGNRHPKKPLRYVKRDDESSVYAVSEEDMRFIPTGALDMRDRVFLSLPKEAIKEVRLKTGKSEQVARKNERGDWISEGPVDRAIVEKIVGDASRLMAIRLVAENEELPAQKFGFGKPMGWLTLTEKSGQEKIDHEFVVGSKTEGKTFLYYKNKKLIAEIPVVVAEELTTPFHQRPGTSGPADGEGATGDAS